jgi:hypothetical protein
MSRLFEGIAMPETGNVPAPTTIESPLLALVTA